MPRYMLLLMLVPPLLPCGAWAQRALCVTPRSQCASEPGQRQGDPCQCPGSHRTWGAIVTSDGDAEESFSRQTRPVLRNDDLDDGDAEGSLARHARPILRNDDLDDGDDVLAGPRHHRPRRPAPDSED